MSEERLRALPYMCVDYAREHVKTIKGITSCKHVNHELDMLLDNLSDVEYQLGLMVTKDYLKEKMIFKNIEIAELKNSLNESLHERVYLISELEKSENHLRDIAPNDLKDNLYIYKWKKYMEG